MSRKQGRIMMLAVVVTATSFLAVESAEGVPAFARKYKFSCRTCHAPVPRLKDYGDDFAGRGFRLAPEEEPARATYDTGDPLLMLPRNLPLAVRLEGHASWQEGTPANQEFELPWVFKILSGGPVTPDISYYFYFIIEHGEVEGLEDAYVQFNRVFGLPVDLMVGQFQLCDPMFKRELRLERLDYEIYKTRVCSSRVNLTYDRGLMAVWRAPAEVDVILQVVNGNGIDDTAPGFDRDSEKHVGLRLARDFGSVGVGVFGLTGKEKDGTGTRENTTGYVGPDIVFALSPLWEMGFQYLYRTDDNPCFTANPGDEFVTRGGIAELHFFPRGEDGRWVFSALYNRVKSDDTAARLERGALTATHLLARNVKTVLEVQRNFQTEMNRASLGFVTAF